MHQVVVEQYKSTVKDSGAPGSMSTNFDAVASGTRAMREWRGKGEGGKGKEREKGKKGG